ncbi:DegT/DnrJ/EryC1/StrS family aminotransferase [Flavisphingomonas formosensis]|uniref:DegT/DnrJ/EryC1/StrS family aminotransferase n=1 Tax=Flavisphingomonas formosensis TaxID=861534 RepID=UPI0012FCFD51|nr:DegT/DnrJ/EryC1/StrS family aminotransferase [Sphingomonas formosensis]
MATLSLAQTVSPASLPSRIASRWPVFADDEIAAVEAVLRSGRVNALHHGDRCTALEQGFAELCAMPHAIALANGTLALEVALRALGVGPGDEVIVPARSFVASASCVMACGAKPVFADIDPESQGLNARHVAACVTGRTRAIIAVHIGGYPAAVGEIALLAAEMGVKLIEDCAQAHGATLDGRPIGSFGDAAAFSFCTDKIMSTGGEGGMLVLREEAAARRAWSLKDHGKDQNVARAHVIGHSFRWLHDDFGSNYRLTEMQAAIGLVQLDKLPDWLRIRRRNAAAILAELTGSAALRLIGPRDGIGNAYYKFYAFVRPERLKTGWSRDRIVQEAWAAGIPCQVGICPEIYRERAFVEAGLAPAAPLPIARELGETSLMLPVDPTLDEESCAAMGRVLRTIVDEAAQ